MRTLVTGGAGFIGSNLVDALLDAGHEVVILDDLSSGKEANLEQAMARGAILEIGDIRDGEHVTSVVAKHRPEWVFHLAAQMDVRVSLEQPALDARKNVEGTVNVLEAGRLHGVQRVVFSSTGGAIYGDTELIPTPETEPCLPMSAYGQSKFCAEQYLGLFHRLYGLSSIALRFGNVYGPRQDPHGEAGVIAIFCGKLKQGERPKIFGTGEQTRDYIYVGDLVQAIIAAAQSSETDPINLGTEEETSVLTLVRILTDLSGIGGDPEFAPARLGELDRSCLAVTRAGDALGWTPATAIAEGLEKTWASTPDP
ncbi:NAD-dependent epimerase/dehydratase family protein [Svornostia abyssi]|uniref:NAD-dependent epimerase/dehydratase family protein n=1 Tax=Svornostia abyssi TaxID=2898438 RepID=A0ABY5PHU8_9ACTN|nr:NAD-dependent epimerase/dehydratase family protein [Parviterribacteraceae bacterium J379]